jgi:hypothetical protein
LNLFSSFWVEADAVATFPVRVGSATGIGSGFLSDAAGASGTTSFCHRWSSFKGAWVAEPPKHMLFSGVCAEEICEEIFGDAVGTADADALDLTGA